ncbi:MAG: winged helix-turn-helix domain-containing protein [Pseudomonadota bacterium]
METLQRIDLAHAADFRIGPIVVRPSLRQIVRDDGAQEVIEPRVMQVLVALAEAQGGILSRADLTERCWDGRIVGEDAINRVLSRLRRVSAGIGAGAFHVETLTKVGYRLVREGTAETTRAPANAGQAPPPTPRLSRRALLGGGVALAAGGSAGGYWLLHPRKAALTPEVRELIVQARIAMRQGSVESGAQAIGYLRRAVRLAPDSADAWSLLAIAYGGASYGMAPEYESDYRTRAVAAFKRAAEIDSDNGYVLGMRAIRAEGPDRRWAVEQALRAGMRKAPGNDMLANALSQLLLDVGRNREAADVALAQPRDLPPTPGELGSRGQFAWAAGRLEEAERWIEEARSLFPRHYAVWFIRCYFLMYTGRVDEALKQALDVNGRPPGIPASNFDLVVDAARAIARRDRATVDAAMRSNLDAAHRGAGFAENALQFAAALGRLDTAFEIAGAYYFERGFKTGELRFSKEQQTYTRRGNRSTHFLFMPQVAPMRADPRFAQLTAELELERYWKLSGTIPDFRRAAR